MYLNDVHKLFIKDAGKDHIHRMAIFHSKDNGKLCICEFEGGVICQMRYIDLDEFLERLDKFMSDDDEAKEKVKEMIEDVHSITVATPLNTCKDCKWKTDIFGYKCCNSPYAGFIDVAIEPDDYCSFYTSKTVRHGKAIWEAIDKNCPEYGECLSDYEDLLKDERQD